MSELLDIFAKVVFGSIATVSSVVFIFLAIVCLLTNDDEV